MNTLSRSAFQTLCSLPKYALSAIQGMAYDTETHEGRFLSLAKGTAEKLAKIGLLTFERITVDTRTKVIEQATMAALDLKRDSYELINIFTHGVAWQDRPKYKAPKVEAIGGYGSGKDALNDHWAVGIVNEQNWYSNTHFACIGNPPASDDTREAGIKRIVEAYEPELTPMTPAGFTYLEPIGMCNPMVVFDNGVYMTCQYFDFISEKFPGCSWYMHRDSTPAQLRAIGAYLYGELVALVMPTKGDSISARLDTLYTFADDGGTDELNGCVAEPKKEIKVSWQPGYGPSAKPAESPAPVETATPAVQEPDAVTATPEPEAVSEVNVEATVATVEPIEETQEPETEPEQDREPWQMTEDEYREKYYGTSYSEASRASKNYVAIIETAMSEGKELPDAVALEYYGSLEFYHAVKQAFTDFPNPVLLARTETDGDEISVTRHGDKVYISQVNSRIYPVSDIDFDVNADGLRYDSELSEYPIYCLPLSVYLGLNSDFVTNKKKKGKALDNSEAAKLLRLTQDHRNAVQDAQDAGITVAAGVLAEYSEPENPLFWELEGMEPVITDSTPEPLPDAPQEPTGATQDAPTFARSGNVGAGAGRHAGAPAGAIPRRRKEPPAYLIGLWETGRYRAEPESLGTAGLMRFMTQVTAGGANRSP